MVADEKGEQLLERITALEDRVDGLKQAKVNHQQEIQYPQRKPTSQSQSPVVRGTAYTTACLVLNNLQQADVLTTGFVKY